MKQVLQMAHLQSDRILSQPCEVFWAGFRSNTYLLQQQGWEIAAEQDYANMSIRILMRHQDLKLFALSRRENFDFYRHAGEYTPPPIFYVNNCATRYEVTSIMDRFENFKQIDAAPQFVSTERKSINDLGIFVVPMVRTEEIIIASSDVSAMLEQIRVMQSPEQKAIRDRERSRSNQGRVPGTMPAHKFHAQILSFDKAA